jgi:hypothetical protein
LKVRINFAYYSGLDKNLGLFFARALKFWAHAFSGMSPKAKQIMSGTHQTF